MFKIFNKNTPTKGYYKTRQDAEKSIENAVKRSRKSKDFEPQSKKDFKIRETKRRKTNN